ncbi:MAG: hypothetical protein PVJ02_02760 [Gemmatimonadota bacterium]|jgi:hypothetical protein
MMGSVVLGRTVTFQPSGDPPGAWAFLLDDEVLAEVEWSDGGVRVDAADEVARLDVSGMFMVRAVLAPVTADRPGLWYAGNLWRGLAVCREGRGFTLVRGLDGGIGPWTGFDDAEGNPVVRIRGRVGRGGFWDEITVTPDLLYARSAGPLLVLWGALRLLRVARPWVFFTSGIASERAVQRAIERMAGRA